MMQCGFMTLLGVFEVYDAFGWPPLALYVKQFHH